MTCNTQPNPSALPKCASDCNDEENIGASSMTQLILTAMSDIALAETVLAPELLRALSNEHQLRVALLP